MNKLIKKLGYMTAAVAVILTGCTDKPTVEDMDKLGEAAGYTTAYVLNVQVKVDDTTRNCIVDVMNEVEKYIPAAGSTYTNTWIPAAKKFVDKWVADGKITQEIADRVMKDLGYIVGLLDKYIEKKEIGGDKDLVNSFVHGFCRGFLANFKPANAMSAKADVSRLDKDTLEILSGLIK